MQHKTDLKIVARQIVGLCEVPTISTPTKINNILEILENISKGKLK